MMAGPDEDVRDGASLESSGGGSVRMRRTIAWAIILACAFVIVHASRSVPGGQGASTSDPVAPASEPQPPTSPTTPKLSPGQVMLGTCILGCLLAASGGPFLARLVARARMGELQRAYMRAPPIDAPRIAYLEAFAIFIAGFIALSVLVSSLSSGSLGDTWWCYAIVPIAMWTIAIRKGAGWAAVRSAIGWHRGRGWAREIGAGLHGYAAGLPVLGGMFILSGALALIWGMPSHPLLERVSTRSDMLTLYLLGCVAAPLVEETMFRGVLFHYLRGGHGVFSATLLSAILFAVIHPQGIVAIPVLTGMALVLAGIREWRGSLIASITAHAFNNAVVLTLAMSVRNPPAG